MDVVNGWWLVVSLVRGEEEKRVEALNFANDIQGTKIKHQREGTYFQETNTRLENH